MLKSGAAIHPWGGCMENKIVVHMKDGVIRKGVTHDFDARKEGFHLLPAEGGGVPLRVDSNEMKALFYVKDYMGNRDFVSRCQFSEAVEAGRKAVVAFKDGEEIWGYLGAGSEDLKNIGFFFFPADEDDNNIRIFVIRSAMEELRMVS
jgi:hypothetical protein